MTDSEVNKSKEYVSKVRAESLKVREIANKVEEMMPRINNVIGDHVGSTLFQNKELFTSQ